MSRRERREECLSLIKTSVGNWNSRKQALSSTPSMSTRESVLGWNLLFSLVKAWRDRRTRSNVAYVDTVEHQGHWLLTDLWIVTKSEKRKETSITHRNGRARTHWVSPYFERGDFEIHAAQQTSERSDHWALKDLTANTKWYSEQMNIDDLPGFRWRRYSDSMPVIFDTVVKTCAHDAAARSMQYRW